MQKQIDRLIGIISHLYSSPDGCPWTRAQTHASLKPHMIEEAYETVETIDKEQTGADLCDELGDVLLQVVLHAQIASSRGAFTFDDVAKSIADKLTRRYPTILGDEPNTLRTPEEIDRRWNEIKSEERRKKGIKDEDASALDNVSQALPALVRADKLKYRASKTGFEWPHTDMLLDKLGEEINELRQEAEAAEKNTQRISEEFGDVLFALVDFARWHGIDAEDSLRQTNNRFESRFRHMEQALKKEGRAIQSCTLDECISYWKKAKEEESLKKTA